MKNKIYYLFIGLCIGAIFAAWAWDQQAEASPTFTETSEVKQWQQDLINDIYGTDPNLMLATTGDFTIISGPPIVDTIFNYTLSKGALIRIMDWDGKLLFSTVPEDANSLAAK